MFIGGCAGSTGGAIKVVRFLIVGRAAAPRDRDGRPPAGRQADPRDAAGPSRRRSCAAALVFVAALRAGLRPRRGRSCSIDADAARLDARRRSTPSPPPPRRSATSGPGFGFAGPMGSFAPFGDLSTLDDDRADVDRPARAASRCSCCSRARTGAADRGVDWRAIGGLVGSLLAVLSLTLLVPRRARAVRRRRAGAVPRAVRRRPRGRPRPAPPRPPGRGRCGRTTASWRWRWSGSRPPCSPRCRT